MKANVQMSGVWIDCPKCQNSIEEPTTGSAMWSPMDMPLDGKVTCSMCDAVLTLPKTVRIDG